MVGGAPVRTLRPPDRSRLRRKGTAMTTAVAARPTTPRVRTLETQLAALPITRLLYMCEAAGRRERHGESSAPFHNYCLGHSRSPIRVLGKLTDPDGRFSAGYHVCTSACHTNALGAGSRSRGERFTDDDA
jgi:hypothetical protein